MKWHYQPPLLQNATSKISADTYWNTPLGPDPVLTALKPARLKNSSNRLIDAGNLEVDTGEFQFIEYSEGSQNYWGRLGYSCKGEAHQALRQTITNATGYLMADLTPPKPYLFDSVKCFWELWQITFNTAFLPIVPTNKLNNADLKAPLLCWRMGLNLSPVPHWRSTLHSHEVQSQCYCFMNGKYNS